MILTKSLDPSTEIAPHLHGVKLPFVIEETLVPHFLHLMYVSILVSLATGVILHNTLPFFQLKIKVFCDDDYVTFFSESDLVFGVHSLLSDPD